MICIDLSLTFYLYLVLFFVLLFLFSASFWIVCIFFSISFKCIYCSWSKRESTQSFINKYDVSYGFLIMAFLRLREFLSIYGLLSVFIMKHCWILSNDFSSSIEKLVVSILYFINMVYYIDFHMLNWPCIPGINLI